MYLHVYPGWLHTRLHLLVTHVGFTFYTFGCTPLVGLRYARTRCVAFVGSVVCYVYALRLVVCPLLRCARFAVAHAFSCAAQFYLPPVPARSRSPLLPRSSSHPVSVARCPTRLQFTQFYPQLQLPALPTCTVPLPPAALLPPRPSLYRRCAFAFAPPLLLLSSVTPHALTFVARWLRPRGVCAPCPARCCCPSCPSFVGSRFAAPYAPCVLPYLPPRTRALPVCRTAFRFAFPRWIAPVGSFTCTVVLPYPVPFATRFVPGYPAARLRVRLLRRGLHPQLPPPVAPVPVHLHFTYCVVPRPLSCVIARARCLPRVLVGCRVLPCPGYPVLPQVPPVLRLYLAALLLHPPSWFFTPFSCAPATPFYPSYATHAVLTRALPYLTLLYTFVCCSYTPCGFAVTCLARVLPRFARTRTQRGLPSSGCTFGPFYLTLQVYVYLYLAPRAFPAPVVLLHLLVPSCPSCPAVTFDYPSFT